MTDLNGRCLIIERNFLIALDLDLILQSFGFQHVDYAADWKSATQLLHDKSYKLAFIEYDQNADVLEQISSEIKSPGPTIVFTSTVLERSDMPSSLRDYRLLFKPYSVNELRSMLDF